MTELADTRHLHIEFRHESVRNEARSRQEGRPIFADQEMVVIRFVGDRRKELVAPAGEKFMRDRSTGRWLSYAEAFPRHYEAFTSGQGALAEGTPLSEAGFLAPARVKEFEALNLRTVEQLAAVEGATLHRLGLHGRDHKNKAIDYLESAKDKAVETRLRAENDDLRKRIEALEAGQPGSKVEPSGFDAWPDPDLRAFIKERTGKAPDGRPSRETLIKRAQELAQPKEAT